MNNVTVVTVTYGKRWQFLSQLIFAVMNDVHVGKLIIVDNGSQNKNEIVEGVKVYGEKVMIIRNEKNTGSAGGFAMGLEAARATDCEYVFLLDDDNVPEEGAIARFIDIKKTFITDKKVVLMGNRIDLSGSQEYFYRPSLTNLELKGTFFEVFSFEKLFHFLGMIIGRKNVRGPFLPIIPNIGFIYGGAFMPIEAVREASLPDTSLVLYGDDIAYSWGVKKAGYRSYVCASPIIHDVDSSFGDSHIYGLFNPGTPSFKVYFRIRNMIRISRSNSHQWKPILFLSVVVWIKGLCLLGLVKNGPTQNYRARVRLILKAFYAGYVMKAVVPEEAQLP